MKNKKFSKTQKLEERVISNLSEIYPGMDDEIKITLWDVVEGLIQRANRFSFLPNTDAVGSEGYRNKKFLNGPLDESEDGIIRQHLWELLDFCFLSICHHTAESLGIAPADKFKIKAIPK